MPHPLITATLSLLLAATLLSAQNPPALDQPHSPPELEQASRSLDTRPVRRVAVAQSLAPAPYNES